MARIILLSLCAVLGILAPDLGFGEQTAPSSTTHERKRSPLEGPLPAACPRSCSSSRTQDIGLILATHDRRDAFLETSAIMNTYTEALDRHDLADMPYELLWTDSTTELREKILELANQCKRVKLLLINSHGGPGILFLGPEGAWKDTSILTTTNVEKVFGGLHCAMAPHAHVQFTGCNVASGCEGEDFMRAVAITLLHRRGGTVSGNTGMGTSILGSAIFSSDLNTQTITVDPRFAHPHWEDQQRSVSSCRRELKKAWKSLLRIKTRIKYCVPRDPSALPYVEGALRAADAHQRRLGASPGFRARARAGFYFREAMSAFRILSKNLAGTGPCEVTHVNTPRTPAPRAAEQQTR